MSEAKLGLVSPVIPTSSDAPVLLAGGTTGFIPASALTGVPFDSEPDTEDDLSDPGNGDEPTAPQDDDDDAPTGDSDEAAAPGDDNDVSIGEGDEATTPEGEDEASTEDSEEATGPADEGYEEASSSGDPGEELAQTGVTSSQVGLLAGFALALGAAVMAFANRTRVTALFGRKDD